jgi:hypothetical protein
MNPIIIIVIVVVVLLVIFSMSSSSAELYYSDQVTIIITQDDTVTYMSDNGSIGEPSIDEWSDKMIIKPPTSSATKNDITSGIKTGDKYQFRIYHAGMSHYLTYNSAGTVGSTMYIYAGETNQSNQLWYLVKNGSNLSMVSVSDPSSAVVIVVNPLNNQKFSYTSGPVGSFVTFKY